MTRALWKPSWCWNEKTPEPCHTVREFSFGGWKEQSRLLLRRRDCLRYFALKLHQSDLVLPCGPIAMTCQT